MDAVEEVCGGDCGDGDVGGGVCKAGGVLVGAEDVDVTAWVAVGWVNGIRYGDLSHSSECCTF